MNQKVVDPALTERQRKAASLCVQAIRAILDIEDCDRRGQVDYAVDAFWAFAREQSGPQWISVREKLPLIVCEFGPNNCYGDSDVVLIFNGSVTIGTLYKSGKWATLDGSYLPDVTHWQPLPAIPEGK